MSWPGIKPFVVGNAALDERACNSKQCILLSPLSSAIQSLTSHPMKDGTGEQRPFSVVTWTIDAGVQSCFPVHTCSPWEVESGKL